MEFRHLPIAADGAVAQSRQGTFQRGSHPSHNGIFGGVSFEGVEDGIQPKTCIGSYAHFADIGRYIGKAGGEQFGCAVPGSGVATTELGVPEVGRVGLHAQQWVIRTFSAIARVVANLSPVLMAEDGHDRAVEIEDEARAVIELMDEGFQHSIVYAIQLFPESLRCMDEKASTRFADQESWATPLDIESTVRTQMTRSRCDLTPIRWGTAGRISSAQMCNSYSVSDQRYDEAKTSRNCSTRRNS